ncbi:MULTISPECIES: DNA repair protein RadA [unclassified Nocardioides]|uniref:DNA repair protein RadA n=1 Tax=unclassified Nocardioides TaxID=2615069 RepID=UPI0006F2C5F5|nr:MULTISPECIES: DNA repair protein RadA [unclassified Nocardioides]KQY50198.1 DNA repair protein RadA [Nocardioides sp. Root140]KQZ75823.1 DNA repair protein RadA [Nocardioides sp. Root151]KRF14894.1 DNA repair protein RadA [Nocardioides sp. Soil796]
MSTKKAARSTYRCSECGWETGKWVGRCGECQAWGSVNEVGAGPVRATKASPVTTAAVPIGKVSVEESTTRSSGVAELDRVLGGGLVPGAAILLAGEPGVGKSTLLLEVAARTAQGRRRTLYITGEESASQVRLRADRTDAVHDELYLAAETDLGALLTHIEDVRPELLVIDSVQTIAASDVDGVPGGVSQVKEVAAALIRVAKTRNITTVLVGHVTKDGTIAGPRVLEHVVDVVLHFEGDRNSRFRMLRAMKNRFGPVDEVGCFDLSAGGITAVTDPSGLFVEHHNQQVAGTCVAVSMEGRRPMLAEVQSLVTPSPSDKPRRTTSGLDSSRVAMVLAVLQKHGNLRLHQQDVFGSTVGGAKLTEPATDLAIAISLASATYGRPAPQGIVAMGELGLAGELRRVRDLPQRLAEAARLGFKYAIVPSDRTGGGTQRKAQARILDGMEVIDVPDIGAVLQLLGFRGPVDPVN